MSESQHSAEETNVILDVAVIGGGLCGVSIAKTAAERGLDVMLFEARARLGGRIESITCSAGSALDLGPTWYWPAAQPLIHSLVERLGLHSLLQHDPGEVLVLEHANEAPKQLASEGLHAGARRLCGGMASLLGALARSLPAQRVHLSHVLRAVCERADHVELAFECGAKRRFVRARQVVLAVPPRLLAEQVRFEPELSEDLEACLHATPTWMATSAKVVLRYADPFWRSAGHSGNAFVQHEQAVLGELFDACDDGAGLFALGAFLALSPAERDRYSAGLPLLTQNQIPQLFGAAAPESRLDYRDWAHEPFTCSRRDLREHLPHAPHPAYGASELTQPHWNDRLLFAGSETADREGGFLEGALVAAERVLAQLPAAGPRARAALRQWLGAQRAAVMERYQKAIFAGLAGQSDLPLTQQALLVALVPVFDAAPQALHAQRMQLPGLALASLARDAFRDFLPELLREVLTWNRRSCALSNFGEEHRPSQTYVQAMLRELDVAFERFVAVLEPAAHAAAHSCTTPAPPGGSP